MSTLNKHFEYKGYNFDFIIKLEVSVPSPSGGRKIRHRLNVTESNKKYERFYYISDADLKSLKETVFKEAKEDYKNWVDSMEITLELLNEMGFKINEGSQQ